MVASLKLALVGLLGAAAVQAIPDTVPELDVIATSTLEERASTCTFSGSKGAASAISSKTSCSTIVLSSVAVPAGTTLDLTGLKKGTTVRNQNLPSPVKAFPLTGSLGHLRGRNYLRLQRMVRSSGLCLRN